MSDPLVRFPGSSWQETEALRQPLRWTVQRTSVSGVVLCLVAAVCYAAG